MDVRSWYCEQNNLDTSQISALISKSLKEKIQLEVTNLRMAKVTPKCGQLQIHMMVVILDYMDYLTKGERQNHFRFRVWIL